MVELIKKDEFIEMIRSSRLVMDSLLSNLTQQQMEAPGSSAKWTIKDVISHIGWYESEMVNVLEKHALEGSEWWDLPLEDRNDAIFASTQNEPLQTVVEKEAYVFKKLMSLLERIDESALNDPASFVSMPSDWQPWSVIAGNTYEHYQDHTSQIKDLINL